MQCEKFLELCDAVLRSWLHLKAVWFLLISRGSFFRYVTRCPESFGGIRLSPNKFKFERLSLRPLKPEVIRQILGQTHYIQTEETTLSISVRQNITSLEWGNVCFLGANGHPRQLPSIFKCYQSCDDLLNCFVPVEIERWDQFSYSVLHHKKVSLLVMTVEEQKDMSEVCLYKETPFYLTK